MEIFFFLVSRLKTFQIKVEISRLNIFVMKYKRLCALGSFRLTVLNVILCHKACAQRLLSSIRKFRFYSQHFNSNLAIPEKSEKKCLELFFSSSCGHNPLSFHNLQLQGAGVIFGGCEQGTAAWSVTYPTDDFPNHAIPFARRVH